MQKKTDARKMLVCGFSYFSAKTLRKKR